jgi:hypothetical protein
VTGRIEITVKRLSRLALPALLLVAAALLAGCQNSTPRLIFDNQSECDGIAITLSRRDTGETIEDSLPTGARREYTVEWDTWYDYVVDYTKAAGPRGLVCTEISRGEVRLPANSVPQVFLLQSEPAPRE